MNIGIVTTWFERGAAYVSRAYEAALSCGHNVFIYSRGGERSSKGDPNWDAPNVSYAPRLHGPLYQGSDAVPRMHFYRWLRRNMIDVVLFNEQRDTSIVREARLLGCVTGAYVDYYTKNSVQDFTAYDFLVCNTKRHYSVFRWHHNCIYVPWGTDTNLFRPMRDSSSDGADIDFFHSAGFGGTSLRKGTDLLVQAFSRVTGRARLVIHSQVPITRYGAAATIIQRDPRITFIEQTVPPPGLYHLGHVYVYPSRLEGIGLSVPEALACGLPVITTDNGPMNEFVIDGYNGFLVKVAEYREREDHYYWPESIVDVCDLAAKMQAYVDQPSLVEEHGRNARAYALESLEWQRNASGLSDFLAGLPRRDSRRVSAPRYARWLLIDLGMMLQSHTARALRMLFGTETLRTLRRKVLSNLN